MTIGRLLSTERDDLDRRDGRTVLTETATSGDEPQRSAERLTGLGDGEVRTPAVHRAVPLVPARRAARPASRGPVAGRPGSPADVGRVLHRRPRRRRTRGECRLQHGRVPGHEFGLRLTLDRAARLLRVEVDDAALREAVANGRSLVVSRRRVRLLLVDVLAVRWGSLPRRPAGKTVRAGAEGGRGRAPLTTREPPRRVRDPTRTADGPLTWNFTVGVAGFEPTTSSSPNEALSCAAPHPDCRCSSRRRRLLQPTGGRRRNPVYQRRRSGFGRMWSRATRRTPRA